MGRMLLRSGIPSVDSPFVYVQPYLMCDVVGDIFFPKFPLEGIAAFIDILNSRAGLLEIESENIPLEGKVTLIPVHCCDPGGGIYFYSPKRNKSWACRIPCDSMV